MKKLFFLILLLSLAAFAGEMKELKTGDEVPAFTLKNYDGKDLSLASVLKENKYAVVMFISTECPVSNAYNERMVKLYDAYSKKGVAFIGINANKAETVENIASHSKDKGFKFPVLKDVRNVIADKYAAQVTPEVFVVNQAGKLMYHGRIDDSRNLEKVKSNDLAETLDTILAGKSLTKTESKAFGCSIKRVSEE
jgi:peroxiredoxin